MTMRAVQYEAFGAVPHVVDMPTPVARPGGCVIRVAATGLCRSDWHGWQGHDSDIQTLPHVPGHEFAGTVAEVGAGVTRVHVGDRVVVPFVCGCGECAWCTSGNAQVCPHQWQPGFNGPGSYAEFVSIPNADFNVVMLPAAISFDVAASLGCRFATAYRGVVDVAQVRTGERVAVFGCGGVGLAAVMVAASRGATVIAVDIDGAALALAVGAGAGATHTINARSADAVTRILELFPQGMDVAVDALGSVSTASAAVRSLSIHGRHLQIGLLPPAVVEDRATVPMHLVISRELRVLGSHGMAAHDYPRLLSEIASGSLAPDRFITGSISLDDAPRALAAMSDGTAPGVTIIHP